MFTSVLHFAQHTLYTTCFRTAVLSTFKCTKLNIASLSEKQVIWRSERTLCVCVLKRAHSERWSDDCASCELWVWLKLIIHGNSLSHSPLLTQHQRDTTGRWWCWQ